MEAEKRKKRAKDGNFINIQSFMVNDLDLKGADLLVYAIIYGFTQDGNQWYSEGLNYICNWVGRNKNTVSSIIDKLNKLGFIEKESETLSDGNTIYKSIRLRTIYNPSDYPKEEDFYSNRYARTSAREVAKQQVLKYSKELGVTNYNCRLINCFLDEFIDRYNERYQIHQFTYQSNSSMKQFVYQVDTELCYLEHEGMLEVLEMYFHDIPNFESNGYTPSIHHMVSDGILEIYARRMM